MPKIVIATSTPGLQENALEKEKLAAATTKSLYIVAAWQQRLPIFLLSVQKRMEPLKPEVVAQLTTRDATDQQPLT
jgi:hypothetical protein